jgi:DNA-binding CsgD family transcriptional regulator
MTESERKQILTLWESGMPLTQVRQMVAMTPSEFRVAIDEMRKNGDFGANRKNSERKVCEAFDRGERNVRAIAKRYGLTEDTVRHYLNWNGRKFGTKTRNFTHCDKTHEIVADLQEGVLTQYKIAQKHQVSRQYVNKVKNKLERGVLDDE